MKKILLGTTAIIGAALLAAPASAEVVNGNGLQLKITGYIEFLAGYISEDNDSAADRDYEIEDRSELNFLVNGKTDTGLTYGGKVGFENISAGNGLTVDEVWVEVGGGWGRVVLGDDDDALDGFKQAPPGIGGADGSFDRFIIGGAPQTGNGVSNSDATKIGYYTPDFGGFKAGITFTPNESSNGRTIFRSDSRTVTSTTNFTATVDPVTGAVTVTPNTSTQFDLTEKVSIGAQYAGAFGAAKVQVGGGFTGADNSAPGGQDLEVYALGGRVGFGAITVGAQWVHQENFTANDDLDRYNFGAEYGLGAWTFGANYYIADFDTNSDTDHALGFGAEYTVAPGLVVRGDATFFDAESRTPDNDGTVLTLRTRVNF